MGITHHLAIDLDLSVHHEMPCLAGAAGEHGAEDGDVEAALHGGEGHVHVGGDGLGLDRVLLPALDNVLAGAPTGGHLGAVVLGHVARVHVGDAEQPAAEHALPVALLDVFAVVGAEQALGPPFLLEEGLVVGEADLGVPLPPEVVEVVLAPRLAQFLGAEEEVPVSKSLLCVAW